MTWVVAEASLLPGDGSGVVEPTRAPKAVEEPGAADAGTVATRVKLALPTSTDVDRQTRYAGDPIGGVTQLQSGGAARETKVMDVAIVDDQLAMTERSGPALVTVIA